MIYVTTAILCGSLIHVICHGWLLRQLRKVYSQQSPSWPADRSWPKAAIVLSLRGGDPFLVSCLRNLLKQDYPDYFLQVVVDSETDPAWEAIDSIRSEMGSERLHVDVLCRRSNFCSLKNSSIIQAISNLPDDREVVAFVDADAITQPNWLRSLITPLADPEVGCTTGIRWFAPEGQSLATRLRCYWNLFAAPVIHFSSIPWGGSMALRRNILDTGLTDEWSRMFCEDAHTACHLEQRRLKLACVPQVTVVNQETTTISGCCSFFNRQMLIFRLYHKYWWFLATGIVFATILRFTHIYFILKTTIDRDWGQFLALVCIYSFVVFATRHEAGRLDRAVRRQIRKSGRQISSNPLPDFVIFFMAEAMSVFSMLFALTTRFVSWRGIRYQVRGPDKITMLGYQPYEASPLSAIGEPETVI